MRKSVIPPVVAAILFGLMVGCAPNWEPPPTMIRYPDDMSDEQREAVSDNKATEDEYTAGYRAYLACLADAGYELRYSSRPSTVYDYAIPEAAVTSGADDRCYSEHFAALDMLWQSVNPPVTKLDAYARKCLADAGLSTEGNINDLQLRMGENGIDIRDCYASQDDEFKY